ncbi:MAG: FAD:protein FMN transferase [Deltaproteobacteria bacterium]|nr:FAD:protein FMN transferase [Deltaproteobacteria bacterium]
MTTPLTRRRFLLGAAAAAAATAAGAAASLGLWRCVRRPPPLLAKRAHACGTDVVLLIDAADPGAARSAARRALAEIFGVHQMMTRFEPSPLSCVNELAAVESVPVPAPLFSLLERSAALNRRTAGLFDVTVGNLVDAIGGRHPLAPGRAGERQLALLSEAVGPQHLRLDRATLGVRLGHPLTALDLGGIAKGHAIDAAAAAVRGAGVTSFLINAGGEVYAGGCAPDSDRGWRVELPEPARRAGLDALWLRDQALATSGNYLQAEQRADPGFAHLVDPRRGAATDRLLCACATAASALEADAWSTAAFVGGRELASRVERTNRVALVVVDRRGQADELWI